MNGIDLLEHGGGGFALRRGGELLSLPDPREQHYQWVLAALHLRHVPGTPEDIPLWQHDRVFERWCAAWDLPEFSSARRLAYLVDNYRAAISNDLSVYTHHDLGALWRGRRWRLLLDVIDRLPAHSWYNATVVNDEKHAKMLADSMAARRADGPAEDRGPSMTTWTPEVAALTNVYDAVRGVQHAVYAAQHGEKAGPPPKAAARPSTALQRAMEAAERQRKRAAHEALAARVLPHKRAVKGESHDAVD